MEKFIIAAPHPATGISNKIKCIVSTLRFCDILSQKPLIYWPENLMCPAKFSDLFALKIPQLNETEINKIKKKGDFNFCSTYSDFKNNPKKYSLVNTWRFMMHPNEIPEGFAKVSPDKYGKNIDLEFERIPLHLCNEYLKYFKKLTPSKKIKQAVDKFVKENKIKEVIGLHVRRGDFVNYGDGRGAVSSDESFFEKISEILSKHKKARFFLATDSKETEKKFQDLFGDKILVYPNKDFHRGTKKSIIDAFIDLLILSNTKQIFGTYLSTFTEVAWWFGGCTKKVEIIGNKDLMGEISKQNWERMYSKNYKNNFLKVLKKFLKKSYFLNKIHEKLEFRHFKKVFSSEYNG